MPVSKGSHHDSLIADDQELNLIAGEIKTELFQRQHGVHPNRPADALHAETLAGEIGGFADLRLDCEKAAAAADEAADHFQFRAGGGCAEHRRAAGVADFEVAGDQSGTEHLIVAHEDDLRLQAIFAE